MTPGERLYGLLVRLLPRRLRREHGHDLLQGYRDRSREPRHRGLPGRLRLWRFLLGDLLVAAAATRRRTGTRPRPHPTGDGPMATLLQDLRYALRSFRRRPGFVLAVLATLALGVGAGTAVYSVVDTVALRALPYPGADRIVVLGTVTEEGGRPFSNSPVEVAEWREWSRTLAHVTASRLEARVLTGRGEPREVSAAGVAPAFFDVVATAPRLGRAFSADENRPGSPGVAVLSHGFWERAFGGDPSVLGASLSLDGEPFTVVGVMGPHFHPPEAIHHGDVEVWMPLQRVRDDLTERGAFFVQALGRLAPGVGLEDARRELRAIGDDISRAWPEPQARWPVPVPLRQATVGEVGPRLVLLGGAVGLLLLIACANVANLFLVRASEREREMAVRTALGAGRPRLLRQLVTESLALAAAAGALALGVAHGAVRGFRAFGPGDLPRLDEMGVDHRVLLFGLALTALTGLVFGLVPAREAARSQPARSLREAGGGASIGRRMGRARGVLVVAQTAVAVVLLAAAGILGSSLARLLAVDPGFDAGGAAWVAVRLPRETYPTDAARTVFFGELQARLAALPGVTAAGATNDLPLHPNRNLTWLTVRGDERPAGEPPPDVSWHNVLPGTFEALGVPLRRGRDFTPADDADAPPVVVVNEAFVRRFLPGGPALGREVSLGSPDRTRPWATVVGVVGDVRQRSLDREPEPELYVSAHSQPRSVMRVVARTGGDPAGLLEPVRATIHDLDPTLPLDDAGTLEAHVRATTAGPRFYAALLAAFGGLALVLAFVGVYATAAYTVEQRTREVGIRVALGADRGRVVRLMVGRVATFAALGLALGLAVALPASGVLEGFVFGMSPSDPVTLTVTTLLVGALAVLAAWLPARRSAGLDPTRALRAD